MSSPSRKSVVCTTATNGSLPDSDHLPAINHARSPYPSFEVSVSKAFDLELKSNCDSARSPFHFFSSIRWQFSPTDQFTVPSQFSVATGLFRRILYRELLLTLRFRESGSHGCAVAECHCRSRHNISCAKQWLAWADSLACWIVTASREAGPNRLTRGRPHSAIFLWIYAVVQWFARARSLACRQGLASCRPTSRH